MPCLFSPPSSFLSPFLLSPLLLSSFFALSLPLRSYEKKAEDDGCFTVPGGLKSYNLLFQELLVDFTGPFVGHMWDLGCTFHVSHLQLVMSLSIVVAIKLRLWVTTFDGGTGWDILHTG